MCSKPHLAKSDVVAELPIACSDETAAVEFLERKRWGDTPACPHCGSVAVYTMKDAETGQRNRRFLWRCRDCKKQFTVRVGTVLEDSPIPLTKWARAAWMASTAKNGVSALELSRTLQLSYKSALFLLNRLRCAMADNHTTPPKLTGVIEADETYVGGKPRNKGNNKRGRGTKKQPVFAALQRGGDVRTRVIASVSGANVREALRDLVDRSAKVNTDQEASYTGIGSYFAGGHETVNHAKKEYARGDVTTNGVEGFFARVKRGINGVFHNVSKEHLPKYMSHFEFLHNTRTMNDGDRVVALIRKADGKRLTYRDSVAMAS